jgi:hypothetical protein
MGVGDCKSWAFEKTERCPGITRCREVLLATGTDDINNMLSTFRKIAIE